MKFWEKFLKTLYKFAASRTLKKIQAKSIESVLKNSISMLDPSMVNEMRAFIIDKQTLEGGFADRAGKCDIYYSLFGYLVAEALNIKVVNEPLKKYVKIAVSKNNLIGVDLFCGAILYVRLYGIDTTSQKLKNQVSDVIRTKTKGHQEYISFLGILALYYLEDFVGMWRLIRQYKPISFEREIPCPVLAAIAILMETSGKQYPPLKEKLLSFYRNGRGFVALQNTPTEDLLSTAVALYALNFLDADIRLIKPSCMVFIDDLYFKGGFLATTYDIKPDVEYTFYGLLGLGSLQSPKFLC